MKLIEFRGKSIKQFKIKSHLEFDQFKTRVSELVADLSRTFCSATHRHSTIQVEIQEDTQKKLFLVVLILSNFDCSSDLRCEIYDNFQAGVVGFHLLTQED